MSELQVIEAALTSAARRRRWARALRGLWIGLLVGAGVCLLAIGAYHLFPLPLWVLLVEPAAPVVCMLAGLVIGGWRKPSRAEVARWVDARQHLQERLSTALEMAGSSETGPWRDLVMADAAAHAGQVDARSLLRFHLPRSARWAGVCLALAFGLGFVPEYRSKAYLQRQADQRNIKEAGKQLTELTRRTLEKRTPVLETTQKSIEAVKELGDALEKRNLTRNEALRDLASVAERLKDQLNELGKDPALKRLEQASRASSGSDGQTLAGLQKQLESMQKQPGASAVSPEALDKIRNQLEKLQQAAKSLPNDNSPTANAARQKLSESLSELSRSAQEMGVQLAPLDDAIQALAANKTDVVLKDLQASMNDLEKMRDMAKALQQLQQQAGKLGKDLAEQLKNGQADAASSTLQKMADQLKSAGLTPEQSQKILDEISKAIDPAGKYGKVAEHLKNASKQMESGSKKDASKELAEAAKELDKLMQQLGDAQSIMAELEGLNTASMSIGLGQGWSSRTRPGFNPDGSKVGSGVGTWADDQAEWTGGFSDHWDNSGIVRPDMDPRGTSDRGDGELSSALKPTKVKGQFSPGGQMPSITLKGVSIKGESKVAYEEAVAAAQSDAQSALSQEKVPRAYRGAVKDYFGDLKKP